jgi:hypothetical protein
MRAASTFASTLSRSAEALTLSSGCGGCMATCISLFAAGWSLMVPRAELAACNSRGLSYYSLSVRRRRPTEKEKARYVNKERRGKRRERAERKRKGGRANERRDGEKKTVKRETGQMR